jgi:hypothetical protein
MTASQDFEIVVVEMGVSQCMFFSRVQWFRTGHMLIIRYYVATDPTFCCTLTYVSFLFRAHPRMHVARAPTFRPHAGMRRHLDLRSTNTSQKTVTQEAAKLLR